MIKFETPVGITPTTRSIMGIPSATLKEIIDSFHCMDSDGDIAYLTVYDNENYIPISYGLTLVAFNPTKKGIVVCIHDSYANRLIKDMGDKKFIGYDIVEEEDTISPSICLYCE